MTNPRLSGAAGVGCGGGETKSRPFVPLRGCECLGIVLIGVLAGFFLHLSWRKWPDPIVDAGTQWYSTWRVSQGAIPYHDFLWNYGPLSLAFNGLLFKVFGPGMMVLAASNLLIYGFIVALSYAAIRLAWGRMAAFMASAVFISVFSFSILNGVGNYNFATPYSNEATHGVLLLLVTLYVAFRWCREGGVACAFLLGLCGGLAAVLKPEIMLAAGVLGIAALLLRKARRKRVAFVEYAAILAGVALPTLLFTAWFARVESWPAAFVDSSQAWWLVLVKQRTSQMMMGQANFIGLESPWANFRLEVAAAGCAAALLAAIWAAGWCVNRPWSWAARLAGALAAGMLATGAVLCWQHWEGGWFHIGRCFPGLILMAFGLETARLWRGWGKGGALREESIMALLFVLLAGAMMARMFLRARIDHFGFFQASPAGMVIVAILISELPSWTGPAKLGRRLACLSIIATIGLASFSIAAQSASHRADQTQPVATGLDRFYADAADIDETGLLVDWSVQRLRSIPPGANLLVLPEGLMVNYLSRHRSPTMPDLQIDPAAEAQYVDHLARNPPDYVLWLTRDLREAGIASYGSAGQPGEKIFQWLTENYVLEDSKRGRSKSATLLRHKPGLEPGS